MKNLIIDELPTSVSVDGDDYSINTDFRIGIMFEQLMLDNSIENEDKLLVALQMYFGVDIPQDIEGAVDALLWFYRCGEDDFGVTKSKHTSEKKIFDYDFDAPCRHRTAAILRMSLLRYLHLQIQMSDCLAKHSSMSPRSAAPWDTPQKMRLLPSV